MKQLTKLEIIEETAKYYAEDPSRRAIDEINFCSYLTLDGRMCAVGRCLVNPSNLDTSLSGRITEVHLELLKPEYQGHTLDFWKDLQKFHDRPTYWSSEGLTEQGLIRVKELKEFYSN